MWCTAEAQWQKVFHHHMWCTAEAQWQKVFHHHSWCSAEAQWQKLFHHHVMYCRGTVTKSVPPSRDVLQRHSDKKCSTITGCTAEAQWQKVFQYFHHHMWCTAEAHWQFPTQNLGTQVAQVVNVKSSAAPWPLPGPRWIVGRSCPCCWSDFLFQCRLHVATTHHHTGDDGDVLCTKFQLGAKWMCLYCTRTCTVLLQNGIHAPTFIF